MIYEDYQRNHVILPGREEALESFLKQDYKVLCEPTLTQLDESYVETLKEALTALLDRTSALTDTGAIPWADVTDRGWVTGLSSISLQCVGLDRWSGGVDLHKPCPLRPA